MAVFKSKEQKQIEKERKQQEKFENFIKDNGLEQLDENDMKIVKNIIESSTGNDLLDVGLALSFGASSEDRLKINYLKILIQQNWLIINQLSRINKKLDK